MEKTTAKPGDYVEIHLMKLIYEGTLLESPENEKGIVLLKLDSGYNIGFNKKDILKIEVLKKAKENENEKIEIKYDPEKPNIALIITGGTIASVFDAKTGGVHVLKKPEDFFRIYPEIFNKVNITRLEVPFMKLSEDMDPKDWQKIAKIVVDLLNDPNIKGVVITHGTDTLHYTSAALSFFIRDLNKPVVLTYSQKSIDRASSDANLNLQCAISAAISNIAEVMLVGHGTINDDFCYVMRGTKVRKLHTSRRDAFKPVNSKPIAKIFLNKIETISNYNLRNKNKAKLDAKFDDRVALIKIYPGQNPNILDYYMREKYKGIVLETTGLGHVPTRKARNSWIQKIKEVQKKGMIVCVTSQCIFGGVDPLVYSTGREILSTGVIYLEDILPETAFVKLGWVLGHDEWNKDKKLIEKKMLENITGEFNKRPEYEKTEKFNL